MDGSEPESWTIARVLVWAARDLRQRGSATARLDAELLLAHALGCDRIRLIVEGARPLGPAELAAYRELHRRRRAGEPVAYLRGEREFYGRPFAVDARVLGPRPETEILVEVALARSRQRRLSARVLDLCTGSGCVAITLAKERPTLRVLASDVSAGALEVAGHNAVRLGAVPALGLVCSDFYRAMGDYRGFFDLITANPPYLSDDEMAALPADVRDFEPHLALSAGPDGLGPTRQIVAGAPALLAPGGVLALEVAAGRAAEVRALLVGAGFGEIDTARDYAGIERVVSGVFGQQPFAPGPARG
ncbi:MAG: peptide chain release factor N(5)-glutamine methyltransferase [Deltaproteobacteria bacterium]|nr:peptide chain release factor N(5)-glutamine methyltransferase [Deltaproteobacteria bacterium]